MPTTPQPKKIETKPEVQSEQPTIGLQSFLDDMKMLGLQLRDRNIRKPMFNYGDLGVTNYLLWLMLAELKDLNSKTIKKGKPKNEMI